MLEACIRDCVVHQADEIGLDDDFAVKRMAKQLIAMTRLGAPPIDGYPVPAGTKEQFC